MQQETRAVRRPMPPAGGVADRWVAQLRRQAKEGSSSRSSAPSSFEVIQSTSTTTSGVASSTGRQRPPSTSTDANRPLSSNPSLFSIDSVTPSSPTTSVSTTPWQQQQRHSANNTSARTQGAQRHRDQLERVYSTRYDAEFDRGLGTSNVAGTSTAPTKLYNPDAPPTRRNVGDDNGSTGGRRPRRPRDHATEGDAATAPSRREEPTSAGDNGDDPDVTANGKAGSKSSKESKRSKRRERQDVESSGGGGNGQASQRGLFNPRTDNPITFQQQGASQSRADSTRGSTATRKTRGDGDSRSYVSASSMVSGSEHDESVTTPAKGKATGSRNDATPFVNELKRVLRDITSLEKRLQDDHRAAVAASNREEDSASIRIQGNAKKYDDTYWVKLALTHKQLADAHYSFLQMALDSRHPASLQTLPKKYNIPTRLWQTAFHQLLERMRHAVSGPSSSSDGGANVLDHLVEFIQYAYGFYTQLYEEKDLEMFRPLWIEQLGDLSRYRMAVAGLASRVAAAQAASAAAVPSSPPLGQSPDRSGSRGEAGERSRPIDAASIGEAALGDWELEEQETWKTTARDWYSQGVKEVPGNGRLQHHLALLSKGDELRSLYHYAKSLTTTHPYASARESILPLFEDELQARRTQPDVTKAELFVHLHGMLFTKISLDDFDDCLARFRERLSEEALLAAKSGGDWASLGSGPHAPFGDAEWFMIGVINISALLQYGAEDGVLKRSSTKDQPAAATAAQGVTPQAIMLNPSSLRRSDASAHSAAGDDDDVGALSAAESASGSQPQVVKRLDGGSQEDPLVFRLAQRLTFGLLDLALQQPLRSVGDAHFVNPYIVLILTFLSHTLQTPAALRHLERAIPWARIVSFFNTHMPQAGLPPLDSRVEGPVKITGSPLPEDWCIRGMDWTGRNLFGRGYWKGDATTTARQDDLMLPPPIGGPVGGNSANFSSETDALRIDLVALAENPTEGEAESVPMQLANARWRRVSLLAAWLVKVVPGLDYDSGRFAITGGLDTKLRRWKQEDDEMAEAERQSRLIAWAGDNEVEDTSPEEDESEEEDDDPTDSDEVRELKARRRELKAVIRQARAATRKPLSPLRRLSKAKTRSHPHRPTLSIFAGHTVLVFDTNILLSSMKLLRDLLEAEKWTIVVPLAVVTELDGLRNNPAPLGTSAEEAVTYLESAIRSYPRHLKVQTSRGNYLKDLSIRREAIDFGGAGDFSSDFARSMDDVILRAVAWQKEHFTSRLALVNPMADRRQVPADASPVVLITFDRNLRLKARARGLDAADEKGMSALIERG